MSNSDEAPDTDAEPLDLGETLMDLMKMVPNKGDSVIVNGWRITNNGTYYGLGTVQE